MAAAVVVANMIGTGVFTSLGFQLIELQSPPVLLMLWLVGGVSALCGALCYAELGAALPRSGGEYNFLTQIYHPCAGFVSGWVSATVGFAAPTALAGLTFGTYLASVIGGPSPTWLATGLILALTAVHCTTHQRSGIAQSVLTLLKLILIVLFSFAALAWSQNWSGASFSFTEGDSDLLTSGAFAVALIYVNYAYSGWNAATYISGELDSPQKNLPRILAISTVLVCISYLLLNFVFLAVAPAEALVGKVEVGFIAATYALGDWAGRFMGLMLAILLISTVSAMILAGPRVLLRIGQDYPLFKPLAKVNDDGIPVFAIVFQSSIALAFLWTSSFERILVFSGATMALNTFVTVLGLFILRWRSPDLPRPFRVSLYPLTPLLFLAVTGWTLLYVILQRPIEAAITAVIVCSGGMFYGLAVRIAGDNVNPQPDSSDRPSM